MLLIRDYKRLMAKTLWVLTCLFSLFSHPSFAQPIESSLGYRINIDSKQMTFISRELLNPEATLSESHPLWQKIIQQLRAHQQNQDYFFWNETLQFEFKDTIRISLMMEKAPTDLLSAQTFCDNFTQILGAVYQKPVQIYQCIQIPRPEGNLLFTEYDGATPNARIMTVHLNSPYGAYEVTASVDVRRLDQRRKEFLAFIKQMQL